MSANDYWRELDANVPGVRAALEKLISDAESFGVYPEFLKTLNLKWARPNEKPVNLGYIQRNGALWTDAAAWGSIPHSISRAYVTDLAAAFSCDVKPNSEGTTWTPYKNGRPLNLATVLNTLKEWLPVMQRFLTAIQQHDAARGDAE